jgi:aminopeptidase N
MSFPGISQFTRRISFFLPLLYYMLLPFIISAQKQDTLKDFINPYRMYDVHHYHLIVKVMPEKKLISGYNSIRFTALADLDRIQIDLNSGFDVLGISQKGSYCKFKRKGDHIFADLVQPLKKGESDSIYIIYAGKPPISSRPPWDGGFVWATDSNTNQWIGVACEGIGASSWWPCKDHLSDEPDSMLISILVPYGSFEVSNGKFLGAHDNFDGYNQFDWKVSYPINPYNVTLNIADYHSIHDTFHSSAGTLSLDYYVLPYHVEKAKTYFTEQVKPMLHCFEKRFGPYPFPKDGYALVETPYWGMEHQGAVSYGNNFKLNEYGFDFIIVHESAHEWWGNSLSVPEDSMMWIHEAFATYSESLLLECTKGHDVAVDYLKMQRNKIMNARPLLSSKDPGDYVRDDNDIYYKGTWMLHTLRSVINNDALWFSIIREFQSKYARKMVTTADFINLVNTMTKKDLTLFFKQYLDQSQIPVFHYEVSSRGKKNTLTYSWDSIVAGFTMPVELVIDNRRVRLNASGKPQSYNLGSRFTGSIVVDADRFYIHEYKK